MQAGQTVSELAVYLPNEDMWMLDRLPRELRTPGAGHWWEMRHVTVPEEARPFLPLWISAAALARAVYREQRLRVGSQSFAALYLDVEWLDADALIEVERLAASGLPVILKRRPHQPGHCPRSDYEARLDALATLPSVSASLSEARLRPLVWGQNLPPCWARQTAAYTDFFFAHPKAADVRYPMPFGFSFCEETIRRKVTVRTASSAAEIELVFEPYQSLLFRLSAEGAIQPLDCRYCPPVPVRH